MRKLPAEQNIVWSKDPHTDAKHVILRKYLDVWIPKLASSGSNLNYIDGFAGPGEYVNDSGDVEEGSPIIALEALKNQRVPVKNMNFLFIEENNDRCENLKRVLSGFDIPKNASINEPICGLFDVEVSKRLDDIELRIKKKSEKTGRRYIRAPTFVFIDPFGHKMPISLIKRLMETPKTEVLIIFVIQSLIRFCSLPNRKETLDELFGCSDWEQICDMPTGSNKAEMLKDLYIRQIKDVANIKHTLHFQMINKHNQTSYFLIFGTNSWHGIEVMKTAMWKVDPSGSYSFSDLTDPNQSTFMDIDEDYMFSLLRAELRKLSGEKFPLYGKRYKNGTLNEHITINTRFPTNKLKTKVLRPMETATPPEIRIHHEGKRRVGTYPEDRNCIIEFL